MDRTFIPVRMAGALALLALASGCATNGGDAATHYWESAEPVPKVQYNRDNTVCRTEAGLARTADALQPVPSFDAYAACMVERGYTLQTY